MFDAGRGAVLQLAKKGIRWKNITRLFITHHHFDHIGELPDLMITSWLNGRTELLNVYGPPSTRAIVDIYQREIYRRDLESRETEFGAHGHSEKGSFASVAVKEVEAGLVAEGADWRVTAWQVEHGHKQFGAIFRKRWICLGYRIEAEGKILAISGDCVPCEGLLHLAAGADLLLQCCWLPSKELKTEYLQAISEYTLACSDVVGRIATDAGVKRLVLTHTRAVTQESIDEMRDEVTKNFRGPVTVAEDLDEFEI